MYAADLAAVAQPAFLKHDCWVIVCRAAAVREEEVRS
jgi:hypothetical protein